VLFCSSVLRSEGGVYFAVVLRNEGGVLFCSSVLRSEGGVYFAVVLRNEGRVYFAVVLHAGPRDCGS
jgi:uncharacterized membrane protein